MPLKVTIKDAAGNPTTLDVHEMHITSNDSANSINAAPTMFQQPASSDTALQTQQSLQGDLNNVIGHQTQHFNNLINSGQVNQEKVDSFNNKNQEINNSFQTQMAQNLNMTSEDKIKLANNSLKAYIDNHAKHFGVPPTLANHPIFQQAPLIQPQQFANTNASSNVPIAPIIKGGSKKRRNKRIKRTRKRRQSRKRSTKR
jgi:hypothetical protein